MKRTTCTISNVCKGYSEKVHWPKLDIPQFSWKKARLRKFTMPRRARARAGHRLMPDPVTWFASGHFLGPVRSVPTLHAAHNVLLHTLTIQKPLPSRTVRIFSWVNFHVIAHLKERRSTKITGQLICASLNQKFLIFRFGTLILWRLQSNTPPFLRAIIAPQKSAVKQIEVDQSKTSQTRPR